MSNFTVETKMNAPTDQVWAILADIGTIHRWNPGVVNSYITTALAAGMGAGRYCDLGGKNYLKEEIFEWIPGRRMTMRIVETNLPFKTAEIRFTLRPDTDGTVVAVSPDYRLKFGIFGKVLDRLYVRGAYTKGMELLLSGLKYYVESGPKPV